MLALASTGFIASAAAAPSSPSNRAPLAAPGTAQYYADRLKIAPAAIRARLQRLQVELVRHHWKFTIGYTTAMDRTPDQLAGTRVPDHFLERAALQNQAAAEIDRLYAAQKSIVLPAPPPVCKASSPSFSWQEQGVMTSVKDQGFCGTCWAFAASAAYESSYEIHYGSEEDISEQDIIDCTGRTCLNGGWLGLAFGHLLQSKVPPEKSYSYRESTAPTVIRSICPIQERNYGQYRDANWGYVSSAQEIPSVDEIKSALCKYGPLAVTMTATQAFFDYTGGVFDENKNDEKVNHAVTIVGWDDTLGAWRIKNSYSTGWGEQGYGWVQYGSNKIGYGAAWVIALRKSTPYLPTLIETLRRYQKDKLWSESPITKNPGATEQTRPH